MERADDHPSAAEAASLLMWWAEAGVDVAIAEEPRDWLRPKASTPAALPPIEMKGLLPAAAPEEALPDQLELFHAYLRESGDLPYASPAAPRVCPAGDPGAGLMILVDMPTGEDCAAGTLLSGEVGRLFERMLAAIGRDRAGVYLAALSCLRSPDGRLAGPAETRCARLARHHIGLAAPKALLLFGDAAARALIGLPVARARGRWHEVATHSGPVRAIVTLSPRQLLAHPAQKAHAWADLQLLMEGLA